jgi:hypothetical protein
MMRVKSVWRFLSAAVPEAVRCEARTLAAALKSVVGRPLARVDLEDGRQRFGAMERSSYGQAVTVLLMLIAVELPAVHLIVGAVMEEGALRSLVRGVLLGSSAYLALWLIGDLRLLRETPGVWLSPDALVIELGLRVRGRVEWSNVIGAQVLAAEDDPPADQSRVIRITPLPRPNCRVRMRSPVSMRGILGLPLQGDMLDLYVDDPAGLRSSVEARQLQHAPASVEAL